jgi:ATP synthase protein I
MAEERMMTKGSGDDRGDFESRLKAARTRQGLDPAPVDRSTGGNGSSLMSVGLRAGVEMVAGLGVGVVIGWSLDRWLHSSPLMLSLFVLMGGAAGVVNVWRMLTPKPKRTDG